MYFGHLTRGVKRRQFICHSLKERNTTFCRFAIILAQSSAVRSPLSTSSPSYVGLCGHSMACLQVADGKTAIGCGGYVKMYRGFIKK